MEAKAPICSIKLDRLIFTAQARQGDRIASINGYETVADFRPRPQGKTPSYSRVRKFRCTHDNSHVDVQYRPARPWCRPLRIKLTADDRTGITPTQVQAVLGSCLDQRPSLVELAFDFPFQSGVDDEYVRQHARFGKSRLRQDRGGTGQLRYGSRSSPKLVRCYWKRNLRCYRVELELHSALLRKIGLIDVHEWGRLYRLVPSHLSFEAISWRKLGRHLRRKFGQHDDALLQETRRRAENSLASAMRFLRRKGILNPHRFLYALRVNEEVKVAMRGLLSDFSRIQV